MEQKQYTSKELLKRFVPYFKKYKGTLCMDLFCAALTTVCELVLPLIMRYITNEGMRDLAALSMQTVGRLSGTADHGRYRQLLHGRYGACDGGED